MGLQIKLVHSLGERVIDVPVATAEQPAVVGRAPNAAVQIPSANIAKQHCLLFVHEGRWVVQDVGAPGGTLLNGEPIVDPSFLNSGDVVTIGGGSSPAELTVDPFGIGTVLVEDQAPAPQAHRTRQVTMVPQAPSAPSYAPSVPQPAGGASVPSYGSAYSQEEDGTVVPTGDLSALGGGAGATPMEGKRRSRFYVPKQQSNAGMIAGVVAVGVVIAAIFLYYVYDHNRKAREAANKPEEVVAAPVAPAPAPYRKPNSIFEEGPARGTPVRATPRPRVDAPTPAPTPTPTPTTPEMTTPAPTGNNNEEETKKIGDPRRAEPEWQEVEQAYTNLVIYDTKAISVAIFKFYAYKDTHAESPLLKDLEGYIDAAADMLWWKRISELMKEKVTLSKELEENKDKLKNSQDETYRAEYKLAIEKIEYRLNGAIEMLGDQMKFKGDAAPNYLDAAELKRFRQDRDAELFDKWKQRSLKKIINGRGEPPWSQSR